MMSRCASPYTCFADMARWRWCSCEKTGHVIKKRHRGKLDEKAIERARRKAKARCACTMWRDERSSCDFRRFIDTNNGARANPTPPALPPHRFFLFFHACRHVNDRAALGGDLREIGDLVADEYGHRLVVIERASPKRKLAHRDGGIGWRQFENGSDFPSASHANGDGTVWTSRLRQSGPAAIVS